MIRHRNKYTRGYFASPFRHFGMHFCLSFPQDHNIHADFQTEWWYVTANLLGEDGLTYGVQFTLFRTRLPVGGKPQPIFFAHAALTTPSEFFHAERYARADMGHGGVESEPWLAFLDHWQFKGTDKKPLPGILSVAEKDFRYNLKLPASPYFLQGDKGFSQKDAGGSIASYYYHDAVLGGGSEDTRQPFCLELFGY